ncbi:DUF402 domain-containing protein [Nocardioides pantholopis]|uniref:DUF402 domain-containing protein n=1 Tax=Nocardioides pantholopis TaxID=2483798 RepID=UPI000F08C281|nr:DUF402 domain-containing protein [Nocardioides pantholopis]
MPVPGERVRVVMTKWGDRPHWEFDGVLLGRDEHGEWLGFPAGTPQSRPGLDLVSEVDSVTLVPATGACLPTFHAPGIWCLVYVDIATPAVWDGPVLRSVDLDLDVIRDADGRVWVDDEDEFAEHRDTLGYPAEVVSMAQQACAAVHRAVAAAEAPYDGTAQAWLDRLRDRRPA